MRILIDDCPRRIRLFQEAFGSNVRTASNYRSAYRALLSSAYKEIYLDHDWVSGLLLAEDIVGRGLHRSAKIFIHSSNYRGAKLMHATLSEAGYNVEMVRFEDVVGQGIHL